MKAFWRKWLAYYLDYCFIVAFAMAFFTVWIFVAMYPSGSIFVDANHFGEYVLELGLLWLAVPGMLYLFWKIELKSIFKKSEE